MRTMIKWGVVFLLVVGGGSRGMASEGFEDLVKLAQTGLNEQALLEYVECSPVAYALSVDEILYLRDLGLSSETIERIDSHRPGPRPATAVTPTIPAQAVEVLPVVELPAQDVVREVVTEAPVVTLPQAGTADFSTFYQELAPYGAWINMDGTWYWQPSALRLNAGWQPYCHGGRWVYTDCGWAWQSSYTWGWAPFHYGRWRHHARYGWLWHPGTVWGPAWVSWRYSDTAIGWAPLPPEAVYDSDRGLCYQGRAVEPGFEFGLVQTSYTFVPVTRFCDRDMEHYRYRREALPGIFRSAVSVENHYRREEHRIINEGPPARRIVEATHQQLRPIPVVDIHVKPGDHPKPATSGNTFSVYRPTVTSTVREKPDQVVQRRKSEDSKHRDNNTRVPAVDNRSNVRTVRDEKEQGKEGSVTVKPVTSPPVRVQTSDSHAKDQPRKIVDIPAPQTKTPVVLTRKDVTKGPSTEQPHVTPKSTVIRTTPTDDQVHRQQDDADVRQKNDRKRQIDQLAQAQELARQQQAAQAAQAEQRRRSDDAARQQDNQRKQDIQQQKKEISIPKTVVAPKPSAPPPASTSSSVPATDGKKKKDADGNP